MTSTPVPASGAPASRTGTVVRVVIIVAVIAVLVIAGKRLAVLVPSFAAYVNGLGATGAVLFVLGYALACVALVPASILTLAAGAIFGLAKGVALVFAGALLGATAAFLIARYVARGAVEKRVAGNARFVALDRVIGDEGRKIVFLLRLSPVFPFSLLNYALGLTRVRLADYVIASAGMLPGTVLYVYYGRLAGDVVALADGARTPKGPGYYAVLVLGLVATVVVTAIVTRSARKALTAATHADVA